MLHSKGLRGKTRSCDKLANKCRVGVDRAAWKVLRVRAWRAGV